MRPNSPAKRSLWPLDLLRRRGRASNDTAAPFTILPEENDPEALLGLERHLDGHARAQALAEAAQRGPVVGEKPEPDPARPRQPSEQARLIEAWGALGGRLSVVLKKPAGMLQFVQRTLDREAELESLLQRDPDASLYLMLQLSQSPHSGYSTSHALLSACLCRLLGQALRLDPMELASLTRAALTMNISISQLQDQLARQPQLITLEQRAQLMSHALMSRVVLEKAGVRDPLWLDIVQSHHQSIPEGKDLSDLPRSMRLVQMLNAADRYGACMAARRSRPSWSSEATACALLDGHAASGGVENTLINIVGLYPPGTYVRLKTLEAAVVVRRGDRPRTPLVVSIESASGRRLKHKVLYDTANPAHSVIESLAACDVEARLDHEEILQLAQSTAPAAPAAPPNWALRTTRMQVH